MISLDKFKVKLVSESFTEGSFEIGPLPRGFGNTLGNSIRRILLSSISGAAVTSIQIDNVKHEYTTLDGMSDDIITLVLKLKDIAVKVYSDEPQIITINVKGKKGQPVEISSSDFVVPSEVELITDNIILSTLTDDIDFLARITVEKGTGYAYADESKRKELGIIPLDANYSPVKRVQMDVVQTRYGQFANLEQVNLKIYTNGVVSPSESLLSAVEIFDQLANKLVDLLGGDSSLNEIPKEEEVIVPVVEEKLLVSQLNLSTRLTNALLNAGITDLKDLQGKNRDEVANYRGMGRKSMTELDEILLDKNISFD
jgi:DNA-directed RNA polymerase subunit alpha